ncbi:MAG: OmpH family outer membrane protein [Pseudomonadota bacterium]
MRKVLIFTVLSLFLMAGTAAAADIKIGLVHMQELATKCDAAQEAQKKMEETFGAERDALEKQSAELQKKAEAMQAQFAALSPEAKEDKRVAFLSEQRAFQEKAQVFQRKVQAAEMRIRQEMALLITKASENYAKSKGYTIIMDGAAAGVLYGAEKLDITEAMLKEVNSVWKAAKK